jgi:hypothetical protein
MNRRLSAVLLAGLTLSFSLAWAGAADAHPGYPDVVKMTLDLTKIYDPSGMSTGCALCHTDPNGGSPLRPFGSKLVQSYGLSSDMVNEQDMSLVNALNSMASSPDANLIADIKKGIDPNSDPGASAGALPAPEYGCATARGGHARGSTYAFLLGLGATAALRARGSKRRRLLRT